VPNERDLFIVHDPDTLRDAWRALSLQRAWLRPSDWYTPEVDLVAEFVATLGDPVGALEVLGTARAANGIGLDETLGDLRCLVEASPRPLDPWVATRAVARGWAEGIDRAVTPAALLGPSDDLATLAYLALRLREIYAAARAKSANPAETHCLIAVDTAVACPDPWRRMRRGMTLGAVMRRVFDSGETAASLGDRSGAAVALAPRASLVDGRLARLKSAVEAVFSPLQAEQAARDPVRVWVESLPLDYDTALALLASLAR
jgi:hypothetical protein